MSTERVTPRRTLARWSPAVFALGALALLMMVFTFPPAQAAAHGFLDLFRVKRFTAITVDPARLEQIRSSRVDIEAMLGSKVQVVKEAGQPEKVASIDAAAQRAGFRVRAPSNLPSAPPLRDILVQGEGVVNITADGEKLQSLLDVLQIRDARVPAGLNGQVISVRKPPMVMLTYGVGRDSLSLIQARSPEVTLPDGVSLSELGELGLRIIGLNASEARQFAQSIDWHTTMLVPVPANAASFRDVSLRGGKGLLITTGGTGGSSIRPAGGARQSALLLWSEGEMVYALEGGLSSVDMIEFANSLN